MAGSWKPCAVVVVCTAEVVVTARVLAEKQGEETLTLFKVFFFLLLLLCLAAPPSHFSPSSSLLFSLTFSSSSRRPGINFSKLISMQSQKCHKTLDPRMEEEEGEERQEIVVRLQILSEVQMRCHSAAFRAPRTVYLQLSIL